MHVVCGMVWVVVCVCVGGVYMHVVCGMVWVVVCVCVGGVYMHVVCGVVWVVVCGVGVYTYPNSDSGWFNIIT